MCFSQPKVNIPDPKPAPAPPNKERQGGIADVTAQRRALAGREGRSSTLLSKVTNEDFAAIGTKKKLGGE